MKVEIEYTELLDIVNALLPRAAHFERLPAESAGLEPDHWHARPPSTGRSLTSCSPRPTTPTMRMTPTLR